MEKDIFESMKTMTYPEILRTFQMRTDLDARDPELQYLLALCLRDGRGVPRDPEKFTRTLEIAANNGSLLADAYLDALARGTGAGAAEKAAGAEAPETSAGEETLLLFLTPPSVGSEGVGIEGVGSEGVGSEGVGIDSLGIDGVGIGRKMLTALDQGDFRTVLDLCSGSGFVEAIRDITEDERRELLRSFLERADRSSREDSEEARSLCREMAALLLKADFSVAGLMLNLTNDNGETEELPVLWYAIRHSDEKIAASLLARGADPNAVHFYSNTERDILFKRSALGEAILLTRSAPFVRLLLESGAEVGYKDYSQSSKGSVTRSMLYYASSAVKSAELVSLLLDYGANPNAVMKERTEWGWQIESCELSEAILNADDLSIIRLLLERGANVNRFDLHISPEGDSFRRGMLYYAAVYRKSREMIRLLIEAGCNINSGMQIFMKEKGRSEAYSTLFWCVQQLQDEDIARYLLQLGADVRLAGPLPRDRSSGMYRLLKSYGA